MATNEKALAAIMQKYQINPKHAKKLNKLEDFKIVLILDDSSSINTFIDSIAGKKLTRWQELSYFTKMIVETSAVFNPNGCDVHFLNMDYQCQLTLLIQICLM